MTSALAVFKCYVLGDVLLYFRSRKRGVCGQLKWRKKWQWVIVRGRGTRVEMYIGMGKTGIPWVPWDCYGNGNTISYGS